MCRTDGLPHGGRLHALAQRDRVAQLQDEGDGGLLASYHLWLHWRPTALYLARVFLDYEPGIHYSQVQMQSGTTGINAVQIYSPIKQVKDHDPRGPSSAVGCLGSMACQMNTSPSHIA